MKAADFCDEEPKQNQVQTSEWWDVSDVFACKKEEEEFLKIGDECND